MPSPRSCVRHEATSVLACSSSARRRSSSARPMTSASTSCSARLTAAAARPRCDEALISASCVSERSVLCSMASTVPALYLLPFKDQQTAECVRTQASPRGQCAARRFRHARPPAVFHRPRAISGVPNCRFFSSAGVIVTSLALPGARSAAFACCLVALHPWVAVNRHAPVQTIQRCGARRIATEKTGRLSEHSSRFRSIDRPIIRCILGQAQSRQVLPG